MGVRSSWRSRARRRRGTNGAPSAGRILLTAISPEFRRKLREERDEARRDTRLKARFLSYRLNLPTADESTVLLTVEDWLRVEGRPVPDADGRPVVGLDMGHGRAWSAAVAVWRSGRIDAVAVAPGTPSIQKQEKRDRVPRGTYVRLHDAGLLTTDGEREIPRAEAIIERLMTWRPEVITCDRARLGEVRDAVRGRVPIVPRVTQWFEGAEDVRALRAAAKDGYLACVLHARALLRASLAAAAVENNTSGLTRMVKRDPNNNTGRDDVAAALVLAAGLVSRLPAAAADAMGRSVVRRISARAWRRLRHVVFDRDGWRCERCGRPGRLEVHHRRPVRQGGADVLDNLVTLCAGCHIAEHAPPVDAERAAWRALLAGFENA